MTRREIFQECQRQIDRLSAKYKSELESMGITIDDASKNYSTIDTLQYNNGDWINIDEHILEIIPDYRLSTSAMLFLAKLYETAIFRILSNQPTP